MSTSSSEVRRQFRLGFFDLNTVQVAEPVVQGPSWIESNSALAKLVNQLEQDWGPVAALGGTLPSGRPVSRASIIEELGVPSQRPTGFLSGASCAARLTSQAIGLCARANATAVRLRAAQRRSTLQ